MAGTTSVRRFTLQYEEFLALIVMFMVFEYAV
jgi:hypothetical protein